MSNNKMTQCKACDKEIAKGVKKCPNCGKDQRNFFMRHKILTGFLAVVVLFGLASLGGDTPSGDTPSNDVPDTGNEVIVEDKTEFAVGETISFKDFDITLSNQREVSGYSNTTYIVFDVEIVSKKDKFSFFSSFQGITEDNEVVDDVIALVQEDLGDPITIAFTKELDKGRKAKGYLAFDREIERIELDGGLFSNEKFAIILD